MSVMVLTMLYFAVFLINLIRKKVVRFSPISPQEKFAKNNNKLLRKRYAILKSIFWPYAVLIEPFGKILFRKYGYIEHSDFRNRGFENFTTDLLKGRRRYDHFVVSTMKWPIDNSETLLRDFLSFAHSKGQIYANIIHAYHDDVHLLWGSLTNIHDFTQKQVSRFQLDQCERMTRIQCMQKLILVNRAKTLALFKE